MDGIQGWFLNAICPVFGVIFWRVVLVLMERGRREERGGVGGGGRRYTGLLEALKSEGCKAKKERRERERGYQGRIHARSGTRKKTF